MPTRMRPCGWPVLAFASLYSECCRPELLREVAWKNKTGQPGPSDGIARVAHSKYHGLRSEGLDMCSTHDLARHAPFDFIVASDAFTQSARGPNTLMRLSTRDAVAHMVVRNDLGDVARQQLLFADSFLEVSRVSLPSMGYLQPGDALIMWFGGGALGPILVGEMVSASIVVVAGLASNLVALTCPSPDFFAAVCKPRGRRWHAEHIGPYVCCGSLYYYWCLRNTRPSHHFKFIGFGPTNVSKPYKFVWLGDIYGPRRCESIGFRWAFISQTLVMLLVL